MASDHVVFRSSHFAVEPGEDRETNPGIYGKALASWIAERLRTRGVAVEAAIVAEDFGRVIVVQRVPFMLWVGCASLDDSTTEWQLQIAAEFTWFARLFRRVDPAPAIAQVREHLRAIVQEVPGVSDIQWQ
jgi:hypothetical protein